MRRSRGAAFALRGAPCASGNIGGSTPPSGVLTKNEGSLFHLPGAVQIAGRR